MTLFTDAIAEAQAAALAWPVTIVQRDTDESHLAGPGLTETHLICQFEVPLTGEIIAWRNTYGVRADLPCYCGQSVFRLHPIARDEEHKPIDQVYVIKAQRIIDSIAAHVRQCHEVAIRM